MAHVLRPNTATTGGRPNAHPTGGLFATDGRPHPVQETLLWVTAVLGVLAFVAGMFHNLHLLSSWAGLVGILTGAYGQWISVTTRQRFALVVGMASSGVGFLLGMAQGGLFGGVVG
ncbi:hypothetical protein ACIQU5_20520 [Streptomyces sp. NPDC090306]|uniref:hypothetical protein n=1 Tax=unclassified Streptomyces TaxID=2593676 RepID=UPI0036F00083